MSDTSAQRNEIPQLELHPATGLWFPSNVDPVTAYQYMIRRVTDVDLAVKHCRKTAIAVQAGGNIGLWPLRLAKFFSTVHTFEPVPSIYGALCRNIRNTPGIVAHNALLSATAGRRVPFDVRPGGVSRVVPSLAESRGVSVESVTIDDLNLPCCDALFLDVEGHELEALAGAKETIETFRPVITVEVWDAKLTPYKDWFSLMNYTLVAKSHGDYIFMPVK